MFACVCVCVCISSTHFYYRRPGVNVHVNFLAPDVFMAQVPVLNNVICEKKVGEGGFGIVYRGVLRNEKSHNEITVAVKTMKNSQDPSAESVSLLANFAYLEFTQQSIRFRWVAEIFLQSSVKRCS